MLFKVLLVAIRHVPRTVGGYSFNEEQSAFSDGYHFSTLEKAKAFCQQYTRVPFEWVACDNFCYAEQPALHANIYMEPDIVLDPVGMPPLSTNFRSTENNRD